VTLGVILAMLHLRGASGRKPTLAVLHGLVGATGFGLLLIALQGPRRGDAMGVGSFGVTASVLFGAALAFGPFIPLSRRRSPLTTGVTIATHACLAIAGFVLYLAWVSVG
jgi:hypothetical protein